MSVNGTNVPVESRGADKNFGYDITELLNLESENMLVLESAQCVCVSIRTGERYPAHAHP